MGWLSKIFSKAKPKNNAIYDLNVSMKGYEPHFTAFGKNLNYSDIVLSATFLKMRFFGKLEPRHIRTKDGKMEVVTDSSVARLMRQPNDFQTMYDFLTQAYFMREIYSNCFIYADYYISNANQRIYTGLYILLPCMQPIIQQDESGKLFIRFQFVNPSREVLFPLEDIIIWKNNMEDNQFLGGGKFSSMANADILNSLQAYQTSKEAVAEAAKLGCLIDGIIKVNAYASDNDKAKQMREQFINDLKENKSGIGVLDNGADYLNIQRQLKMVDAATLKEIKENVLMHTGVSIEMLMGKGTQEMKDFLFESYIQPASISFEQAMSKVFFSQNQETRGDRIQIYPRRYELMTIDQKIRLIQSTIPAGIYTIDEIREMTGFAPLPNEEGKARPRGYNSLDGEIGGNDNEGKVNEGN